MFNGRSYRRVWVAFGRQQFLQNTRRIASVHWVFDSFFRHPHAFLTKVFEHIGFGDAAQTFELNVPDNRQFNNDKSDIDPAAWTDLFSHARSHFIEET